VTSWIVPFVQKTKDDPRSHTNQHEPKHSCLELDPTFEAKLSGGLKLKDHLFETGGPGIGDLDLLL